MTASLRGVFPSSDLLRALVAPILVFIATAIDRNYQTDFWHHLARGQAMTERGELVDHDLFTYTVPDRPFQDVNWLTQLLYYRLFLLGGLDLVQFVNSLTLAVMMGLLVALCRRQSGSWLIAAAVGLFAFVGLWQLLIIRPQTFSLLLFMLVYLLLEQAGRRRWLLVIPPVLLALWANLHGAFPIGLVLIGCYGLSAFLESWWTSGKGVLSDRMVWFLGLCLLASCLATLANPYEWRVYQ